MFFFSFFLFFFLAFCFCFACTAMATVGIAEGVFLMDEHKKYIKSSQKRQIPPVKQEITCWDKPQMNLLRNRKF